MQTDRKRMLVRFSIELVVYGLLVAIYLVVVLRTLGDSLAELSWTRPVVYALGSLALIVAQGFLLEIVTSFLLERLGLE